MNDKKIVYGLDIFKLVCAFIIVLIHTYNQDWGAAGRWFHQVIATIGVPFFFIVSGYFYGIGLNKSGFSKNYFIRYFKRILTMYLAWSVITLPVSWLCIERGHPEYSLALKIIYLLRMILFSGSCGIYWYVLALVCCSIMIYYFMKNNKAGILYAIAIICFAAGVWYNSPYNDDNMIFRFVHAVFGSERNFLNVGLIYMCIGYFFSCHSVRIKPQYLLAMFACFSILRTYEIKYLQLNSLQLVLAVSLFLFALELNVKISDKKSVGMRKLSTVLYLVHFPFILLFDYYLKRGTAVDYPITLCITFAAFLLIEKLLPDKWRRVLIG